MTRPYPFRQLFMIMAAATLLVTAISISILYLAAVEQYRLRLADVAQYQASLIETIAEFDLRANGDTDPAAVQSTTLDKVDFAQRAFRGFGESGEIMLARRRGDEIEFIVSRRPESAATPRPIPFDGEWAEPMRRALTGESGVVAGLDYRGVRVLAAYEPVGIFDLGLVAKIDIAEIRTPFVHAGLISVALAVLVIFIASRVFFRVSAPIQHAIDRNAETFLTLAETTREGIILADTHGIIEFVNPAAERLFGFRHGELVGEPLTRLMPAEHAAAHDGYVKNYLHTGIGKIIGVGRQLTAMRKDGTRFPIYLSIGDIRTSSARLFAGVILDMSEQQQLQREILQIPVSEQRRIGQELHDGLGQQLTGLGLLATSLVNKASKVEHDLARRLADGLQDAIAQVRALSRGLMPVDVDAEGFMSALQTLIDEVRAHSRIAIELVIEQPVRIADNNAAMHLYRIAQEAINNALKHADANRIEVCLGADGNRGFIAIRDDGRGFDRDRTPGDGLGLRIMQHRCGLIDAQFTLVTSLGDGTEIKCYFPIDSRAEARA